MQVNAAARPHDGEPAARRHGLAAAAPLPDERAAALVERLPIAPGRHVLALGGGANELLLRILARRPATTGTAVALDREAQAWGRRRAVERGLQERVDFVEADVRELEDRGDIVLCVGAAHAWGGIGATLAALRERVERGGLVLFGEGLRTNASGQEELVAVAERSGFRVLSAERSRSDEQDGFAWLVLTPRDP